MLASSFGGGHREVSVARGQVEQPLQLTQRVLDHSIVADDGPRGHHGFGECRIGVSQSVLAPAPARTAFGTVQNFSRGRDQRHRTLVGWIAVEDLGGTKRRKGHGPGPGRDDRETSFQHRRRKGKQFVVTPSSHEGAERPDGPTPAVLVRRDPEPGSQSRAAIDDSSVGALGAAEELQR